VGRPIAIERPGRFKRLCPHLAETSGMPHLETSCHMGHRAIPTQPAYHRWPAQSATDPTWTPLSPAIKGARTPFSPPFFAANELPCRCCSTPVNQSFTPPFVDSSCPNRPLDLMVLLPPLLQFKLHSSDLPSDNAVDLHRSLVSSSSRSSPCKQGVA
jgi:hypothetical protein